MAQVKISDLPEIIAINANTANTLFAGVDIPTDATFRMTAQTLARGLYSNEILNVGTNPIVYDNVAAQFAGNSTTYLQVNLQNFTDAGSSDYVASTSDSDNTNNYVDMGINGKSFLDPIYSSMKPYDAYVYSHGPAHHDPRGNLIIGTASESNVVFISGGTQSNNIVAFMTANGLVLNTQSYIVYADGSKQSVAYNPGTEATQNTRLNSLETVNVNQNTAIGIIQGVDLGQNTTITQVNQFAGSAYNKANNALANTNNAIFGGNLTVTGNVYATGISTSRLVSFLGSSTPASNSLVDIIGSTSGLQQTPSNDGYMLHITGKDDIPTRIVIDAFGANSYPLIAGRKGRGVAGTPLATSNNDILMRISSNGWGSTGFAPLGSGRIDFVATENYTDATRGSKIVFYNIINGTNTINQIASFNANSVEFTGTVSPAKGFIYNPTTYTGAQTAITIDFANATIIRAQTATGLTVSFTNYVYGKAVELWVTNTAGTNQTFTHGCSALNSSVNATTYNIPATSSILARYMSFDGDLANTFVSIIHA